MLVGESRHSALQGESRARSPQRVVGLIAPAVERGDDPVADELLDLAAEPTGEQRRRRTPVRIQHRRDLGRRGPFGEAREAHEVAEEDADVLAALARGRQVEISEALVAPFATDGKADDQIGEDDQAVPLPPARVPLALPGERDADHRFGEQQETGDDSRRKQRGAVSEQAPVPNGAHRIDDRPEDRQRGEHASRRGLVIRPAQRWQVRERPEKPHGHDEQHRSSEHPPVAHQPRPELGPHIDERRARSEECAHEQPDRDRDLEAGAALGEEDAGRAEGV